MSDTASGTGGGSGSNEDFIAIDTPLGPGVLRPELFEGEESFSEPFRYRLRMLSHNKSIDPRDIVNKNATVTLTWTGEQPWKRLFNGIVRHFSLGPMREEDYREYYLELVPWLWFLTRRSNCRIYQDKKAPDIVEAVFKDAGFTDYKLKLSENHPKREYCVQYRETDFAFVSRLCEEEGIFYFHQHEKGKHTLVLADNRSAYFDCPDPENKVDYHPLGDFGHLVNRFEPGYAFRSGVWTQRDYYFETPDNNLETKQQTIVDLPGLSSYELYDYPGLYTNKSDGQDLTKVRMEVEEAAYQLFEGTGACSSFQPGAKFALDQLPVEAENNKTYVLSTVRHTAIAATRYAGQGSEARYSNSFTCLLDKVLFQPPRKTPKAVVRGPHTAFVVGPQGEEIYCDKYGRVKVQFHWDRYGKKNEQSSCWMRVAQLWAGKNWGAIFIPRIGMEVLVDFLEGDPDRPLITGCVYNANYMPPYTLPDNKTQSGLKTRSSKGGGTADFNELRFEDKKDLEEVYFHAQKDYNRVVEHDDTLKVGHDQTIEITNNRTETIDQGNDSLTLQAGNRSINVDMGSSSLTALQSISVTSEMSITLTVGPSSISITPASISLSSPVINLTAEATISEMAPVINITGTPVTVAVIAGTGLVAPPV